MGTVGQNDFFYEIRWSYSSILALEPKCHEDWYKNGHTTRQKSQNPQKWTLKNVFLSKIPQNLEFLKEVPESSHQTVFLAGTNILGHKFCPKMRSRALCSALQLDF